MALADGLLVEMYRRILRIRFFEEKVLDLKGTAEIPGAAHICIGHEATLVGACMARERLTGEPNRWIGIALKRARDVLGGKGAE